MDNITTCHNFSRQMGRLSKMRHAEEVAGPHVSAHRQHSSRYRLYSVDGRFATSRYLESDSRGKSENPYGNCQTNVGDFSRDSNLSGSGQSRECASQFISTSICETSRQLNRLALRSFGRAVA